MHKKPNILLGYLMLALSFVAISQDTLSNKKIGIGEWRVHLPYYNAQKLATDGEKIYCLTTGGLYFYSESDGSVNRLSKVEGLSDATISSIKYSEETKSLVIAYKNANIDIIKNGKIINLSDIKRKNITGNKTINNIHCIGNLAYLACGFGIVVLDLTKEEIKDTYIIGPGGTQINILDITSTSEKIFAGTEKGMYTANLSNLSLADYNSWKMELTLPRGLFNAIENYNDIIVANFSKYLTSNAYQQDTLYKFESGEWKPISSAPHYNLKNLQISNNRMLASYYEGILLIFEPSFSFNYIDKIFNQYVRVNDALYQKNKLWIAESSFSLIEQKENGSFASIVPNGPGSIPGKDMDISKDVLWVAPGGKNSQWSVPSGGFVTDTISYLIENIWKTREASKDSGLFEVESIAVNPSDPLNAFIGSWGMGLLEFKDGLPLKHYNSNNSSLQDVTGQKGDVRIGGLAFDKSGNLWVSNYATPNPISVKTPEGNWKSFSFSGKTGSVVDVKNPETGRIMIYQNQKWLQIRNLGIGVYDDKGTILDDLDDAFYFLNSSQGTGGLPSSEVYSFAEDKNGEIWVGTDKGIGVFYSPENIATGKGYDAQPIVIEQDGYIQHLLETETVTAIEVDGANRKWLGTSNSGVYLMSPDGTREIIHFTAENSPLLSNNILSMAIDGTTGEVYFGTDKGIISYKATATEGDFSCDNLYAYPNPVRDNYDGLIGIKGMMPDAEVKITDITGNLVYKTKSEGGQAVWDGNNLDGTKVSTGVYMIFSSTEDGTTSCAAKLLIIN